MPLTRYAAPYCCSLSLCSGHAGRRAVHTTRDLAIFLQEPAAKRAKIERDAAEPASTAAWTSTAPFLDLLRECELRIWDVCRRCGFDRAIAATACAYFKRFYTRVSPTARHPLDDHVLHACIFLAIKTEACPYREVAQFLRRLVVASEWRLAGGWRGGGGVVGGHRALILRPLPVTCLLRSAPLRSHWHHPRVYRSPHR